MMDVASCVYDNKSNKYKLERQAIGTMKFEHSSKENMRVNM